MKSTLVRPSDSASVDPLLGVPYRLQVAASVTRYQSCTVDPRPGRVVHCPDLNACLVNEGRTQPVDCNAVHYGYAIPVNVVPIQDDPNLAELVLDTETDLTPETVSYLINHHPQLRGGTERKSEMATTANHRGGKFSEPEEDIAAIAKQISDHAEAIYQTWKSRGLAPTEILNCHSNVTAADKFGSVLTPQPTPSTASPVVDLLSATPTSMNTNNLEQLVNNFVVEDKARLARQQKQSSSQGKNLPSSIQFALQKFEKKTEPPVKTFPKPTPVVRQNEQVLKIYPNAPKINYSQPKTTKNISPFIMDTIETTFPEDFNPSKLVTPTPVKTEDSGSGLTTWPLKTKTIVADTVKKLEPKPVVDNGKYATLPTKTATANEYLDEVAKEEERLINALKTGIIIAEDPNSKRNAGKKTTGLLQKKNNVKDKTQIVTNPEPSIVSSKASELDVVDYGNSLIVRDDKPNVAKVLNKIEPPSTRRTPNVRTSCSPVPHPELTGAQRNHIRTAAANGLANHVGNPVRPFLTRGSVAERVLIFEKCPTELMEKRAKSSAATGLSSWRTAGTDVHSRAQNGSDLDGPGSPKFPYKPWKHPRPRSYNKNYSRESLSSQKSTGPPPHTTLQRHTKANRSLLIPRFHYPQGKPSNQTQLEVTLEAVRQVFQTFPNQQVTRDKFSAITKAAGCPLYWKAPLFIACGGEKLGYVELNTFLDYWRSLCTMCHDNASRFMRILTRSTTRNYLLPEDLMSLVQDVVDTHPGLTFLKEAAEFHSRYVHTVISRIYYCVNQSWSGQITLPELRKSDFLRVVQLLETEDDINQVTQYFSYEHFYVIYCKFWELDRDHDLFIDKNDLARHSDHALSTRLIHRIFSGTVTRGKTSNGQQSQLNGTPDAKMSYTEFVWFLLAEEDKQHPRAIEYWFRCMDLDGDGYLSMYELEYFYDEQLQRMEAIGIECLPFEDCLCQMLDMIRPAIPGKISLTDLKKCKMTPIFFDTFFNLEKYLDHEQRDPFASQRDHDTEMSDWDRYAAEEYELLVAEEGGNDNQEEFGDEDGEGEDALSPNLDHILSSHTFTNNNTEGGGNKPRPKRDWSQPQPSLTVTDFDDQDESSSDSADYAADSDDCSM